MASGDGHLKMQSQSNLASVQSMCAVRAPEPGDYDRMADSGGTAWLSVTGQQVRVRLDEMANSNDYAVYVAELSGGQIAGWIGVCLFRAVELDSCAEISGLIVDQQVRSRGIGKVLTWRGRRMGAKPRLRCYLGALERQAEAALIDSTQAMGISTSRLKNYCARVSDLA